MSYTKTGPFTDGKAPQANAAFFNNVENLLASVNSAGIDPALVFYGGAMVTYSISINAKQVNTSGTTAGNIVCYQPFVSPNFKVVIMLFNGYRNNAGHTQGVVIPAPFTQRSKVWAGDLPSTGVQFQKAGSSASIAIITAVAAAGGTVTNSPTMTSNNFGEILGGWDTMIIPSGGTANVSGVLLIVGW